MCNLKHTQWRDGAPSSAPREPRANQKPCARLGPNFGRLVHAKGFGHRIESRPRTLRIYGIKTLRYGQPSARAEAHNIAARISGSGHSAVTDASTPRASPRAHATPRTPQLGADPDYNTTATLLTTVLRGSGRELELECPLLTGMSITEQVRLSMRQCAAAAFAGAIVQVLARDFKKSYRRRVIFRLARSCGRG